MVRDAGFEPDGKPCKIKGSSRGDTRIDTRAARDLSEFCEIIAVWPQLPPPLRAAVLAIIRTHGGDLSTNRDSEGCGSPSQDNSDAGAKPEQPVWGQVGIGSHAPA